MKRTKPQLLEAMLVNISSSVVTEFLLTRLNVRELDHALEHSHILARIGRRAVLRLEAQPFNKHRVEQLRVEVQEIEKVRDEVQKIQRGLGQALIGMAPEFDAATTFEQRCDLLNVNVADRAQLPANCGLIHMASVYRLEDSATNRSSNRFGPLFAAIQEHMEHVMFTTPAGQAAMDKMWEKLTEPGGLFQGLPIYDKADDGSMVRRPPKLALVATTPTIQPESQQ